MCHYCTMIRHIKNRVVAPSTARNVPIHIGVNVSSAVSEKQIVIPNQPNCDQGEIVLSILKNPICAQ